MRDRRVLPEPAARCVQELADAGVAIEHSEYDCGHRVLPSMVEDALAHLDLAPPTPKTRTRGQSDD